MRRAELEHLIRAAAAVTNEYEIVVIGSQSILGSVPAPPPEPEDLDNWVRGLGEDRLGSEGHSHPRWRSTSNTEESTL